ncbi:hypothetical protein S483_001291 [Salmonella enterica subsp. salamae]|nr:hypothetical protein [Salmonella enterica subsp. salamae]
MSKYRKGAMYLRHMKSSDKASARANSFRTAMRLGLFSDPKIWKHPERVKPVVLLQHGISGVGDVWMNREEAIRSLLTRIPYRRRNARHNPKRGLRATKGDLRKAFRGWAFKHRPERIDG